MPGHATSVIGAVVSQLRGSETVGTQCISVIVVPMLDSLGIFYRYAYPSSQGIQH